MKILHLEDNPRDAALVRDLLSEEWPECFISVVATRGDFESLLKLGGYDLIISDYQLPGFNGLDALDIVRDIAPDTPFVFFSGTLGEESAIDAVRSGAADYVIKDRVQRLPMSVRRVLREAKERRERHRVEEALAQEQSLLRLLMENLPDHVYFKDLQSAFISVSRSKARSHGLEPEQMKGRSDFEIFGPKHARRAFEDEQRIIRTGEPMIDVEEQITWPDGSVSWMAATKLPLKDTAGNIIGTSASRATSPRASGTRSACGSRPRSSTRRPSPSAFPTWRTASRTATRVRRRSTG
jgi:PAS domain S-box-containing protein